MSKRRQLNALIMRTRPYRETSLMVDVLTREMGRFAGVQKGYRSRRGQRSIQPFLLGVLDTSVTSGLANIYGFETTENLAPTEHIASGFYTLEIVFRALGERQVEPEIFDVTIATLAALTGGQPEKPILRHLERTLLDCLGYGVDFGYAESELSSDTEKVVPDRDYVFVPGHGFVVQEAQGIRAEAGQAARGRDAAEGLVLNGSVIAAIEREAYGSPVTLAMARQLYQTALLPLIGDRPLESRKLLDPQGDRG